MFKRIVAAAFACALPAAAMGAASEAPAPVQLGDFGGRLRSVELIVNGQRGLFTIDTGGGVSLISPDFAKRIGCIPWGAHTGFRLTGERLDLPRCEGVRFQLPDGEPLRPVSAGVIDLKPLLFEGAPAVDGSLALDAFEGRAFSLDLGNGILTLETRESLPNRVHGASEIPIRLARQAGGHALAVMVPVATANGKLWMSLDSGGGPPVLLRDKVAALVAVDPSATAPQPYTLSLVDGEKVEVATRAIVRDMILDGVIGMPVLVQWSMTFDLDRNRLWLRKTR